jgi:protein farnesyltransferase subunit beta
MLNKIPGPYHSLNAGLPWFAYWTLNIFDMLNKGNIEISREIKLNYVDYLKELHNKEGGFSGYSKGISNVISSYAAILAICILDIPEAYDIIDIKKMKEFILKNKNNDINNTNAILDKNNDYIINKGNLKGK